MSKDPKHDESRRPGPTHTHSGPAPNWPLLAVSSLGMLRDRVSGVDRIHRRRSAGMLCRRGMRRRSSRAGGQPFSGCRHPSGDSLGYAALATIAFVRRVGQALVLRVDRRLLRRLLQRLPDRGVADDSRIRVSVLPDVSSDSDGGHPGARGVSTASRDGAPLLVGFSRWPWCARGGGHPCPPRRLPLRSPSPPARKIRRSARWQSTSKMKTSCSTVRRGVPIVRNRSDSSGRRPAVSRTSNAASLDPMRRRRIVPCTQAGVSAVSNLDH